MLKKLRGKFIAMNMAIVAMVLSLAFGSICLLAYAQDLASVNEHMRETLDRIADARAFEHGNGDAPDAGPFALPHAGEDGNLPLADSAAEMGEGGGIRPPEIGGGVATRAELTPTVAYAVDARGNVFSLTAFSTAVVPDEYLGQAVSEALSAEGDFGRVNSLELLYGKRVEGEVTLLAFIDASAVAGWKALALILAPVGILAFLGFLVVSVFFARWSLRPVEAAWDQQRRFVADASHELKTPLTVILANAAILRAHPEESVGSQSQWIESTQAEAKRMQGLVNDLLDLARLDGGVDVGATFSELDLSDLVEAETLQFESVAYERGIELNSTVEKDVLILGDTEHVRRLVRTLIDNACKYAASGGHVDVSLHREGHRVKLSVTNSGIVIDAQDLPHVFDRFYRADSSRTRDTGGSGLGLAIAREIALEHKGDIIAASSPATGTTFTVALPLL